MDTGSSGIDVVSGNRAIGSSVTPVTRTTGAITRTISRVGVAGAISVTGAIAVSRVPVAGAVTIAISRVAYHPNGLLCRAPAIGEAAGIGAVGSCRSAHRQSVRFTSRPAD